MAKCVVCKMLNAKEEAKKHPNFVTTSTARLLTKRVRATNRKTEAHRFCEKHSEYQFPKEEGQYVTQ